MTLSTVNYNKFLLGFNLFTLILSYEIENNIKTDTWKILLLNT